MIDGRVVVLGGTGYVGSHLYEYYKELGVEVVSVSSAQIDLLSDGSVEQLSNIFGKRTKVIMCSGVKSDYANDIDACMKNIQMARNVNLALIDNPVDKFIFFSSIAVYGVDHENNNIAEDSSIEADTFYGLSKYTSEKIFANGYVKETGGDAIFVRTPTIYGAGDRINAQTPSGFLNKFMANEKVELWGEGEELREFIYIDDIVYVINALLESDFSGAVNVGTGVPRSYKDAVDIIAEKLARKISVGNKKRTKNKIDKIVNAELLQRVIGGYEFTTLEDGMNRMLSVILNK